MRARGIDDAAARALLILAFAREPFDALDLPEQVQTMLDGKIQEWLGVAGRFDEMVL